jgi:predicted kinase
MINKPKAFMLIGLPGSGKSTFAKKMQEKAKSFYPLIINRDNLRRMVFGDVYKYDLLYEPIIKAMTYANARAALFAGFSIILDETSLFAHKRAEWLMWFKALQIPTFFVYFPENGNNLEYRMKEPRGYTKEYWQDVINSLRQGFVEPSMHEGVKEVFTIKNLDKDVSLLESLL